MDTAVIYSNGSQECERMSMLLKSIGGEFHEYYLGKDFNDGQFLLSLEMKQNIHKLPLEALTLVG